MLPGGTPHFHWVKSGTYVTQVSAVGPLGLEEHKYAVSTVDQCDPFWFKGIVFTKPIIKGQKDRDPVHGGRQTWPRTI